MDKNKKLYRRKVLNSVGALGVGSMIGLSGCMSNSENDSGDGVSEGNDIYRLNMAGGGSGSSTNAAGQALSRAMSEHSDSVRMNIQETEGWVSNTYLYDSGEFLAASLDNNTAAKAASGRAPFDSNPVSSLPLQGFVHSSLHIYWVAVEGSGIESTTDLPGSRVYPIQPGFGTRGITEEIIKIAGIWDDLEVINVNTSDIAGAVEEGRVDALAVYGSNFVSLSGWVSEVDARNDLYAIEVDDNFAQAIEDAPGARLVQFEPYGWQQDVTGIVDEVQSWALEGQFRFGPEVPDDVAYEIARVSHDHNDTVREADPNYADHNDAEAMAAAVLDNQPIHPGIARFFKDQDVWNDNWQVGDGPFTL